MFDHPPVTCLSSTHQQAVPLIFMLFNRNYINIVKWFQRKFLARSSLGDKAVMYKNQIYSEIAPLIVFII